MRTMIGFRTYPLMGSGSLSFMPAINPTSHRLYKRVMLRLMPASGGAPRVIAYLCVGREPSLSLYDLPIAMLSRL